MCDEFVRRRWLSISQGFVPILATCTSFKKWVRTVPFDAASSRARPSANDVAFRFTPACNTSVQYGSVKAEACNKGSECGPGRLLHGTQCPWQHPQMTNPVSIPRPRSELARARGTRSAPTTRTRLLHTSRPASALSTLNTHARSTLARSAHTSVPARPPPDPPLPVYHHTTHTHAKDAPSPPSTPTSRVSHSLMPSRMLATPLCSLSRAILEAVQSTVQPSVAQGPALHERP